jgi:DNA-binding winged helix-turn-helix (wHTH) protein/Tfp pilus assembly protein PilF
VSFRLIASISSSAGAETVRYNRATPIEASEDTSGGRRYKSLQPAFVFLRMCRSFMTDPSQLSYEFGPFSLDAGKRLLLRNGEPVPVTPKVMELLLVLIEHRDRVLTKDELLKQVWGDTIVEEGGLTRNVSVLRKTLGEKPDDHQYIVTVPARGYRFVAEVRERRQQQNWLVAQPQPLPNRDGPRWGLSARGWLVLGGVAALVAATVTYATFPGRATPAAQSAVLAAPAQARQGTLPAVDPAAYDSVLRARYLSVRTTDADTQAAIALLEHAVAIDPAYARAYADLAAAYVTRLTFVTPEKTGDLEQKAFAAAEKALLLDPGLPEGYMARGDLLWTPSHHFAHERAIQEFRRAVELNPKSDQAHRRLARVYVHLGFFEEAIQHADVALAINPSNAQALNSRAQALLWMGKDEDALDTLLSIPGPVLPELVEANTVFALLRLGRREEAWVHLRQASRKYPDDPSGALPSIEAMLLAESEPLKAQMLIKKVAQRKAVNPSHHAAYFAAAAWARMGHAEEAVRWMREAAETGFPCYPLFARDPNLDPIRQDTRFQAFLAEMQKHSASLRKALVLDRK